MGLRGTGAVAALALIVVAVAVWLLTSSPAPLPMAGSSPDATTRDAAESVAAEAKAATATSAPEVVARRASEPPEAAPPRADVAGPAVFRGRIVDTAGEPLAGATARLQGWISNSDRMDAYRAEHGEVDWTNPAPVATGPDGRFEIAFVPPPPFQFALDLIAPELVTISGRWSAIEPGTVKDFGDVMLEGGARVTGRLVDADGRSVALPMGETVRLSFHRRNRQDRPKGELTPRGSVDAELQPDGSFVCDSPADPGMWNVSIRGFLLDAREQEVSIAAPATEVEVVVLRPERLLRVSGVVVDDAGQPLRGVELYPLGIPRANNELLSTRRDGSFEIVHRPGAVDPAATFGLSVAEPGYQRAAVDGVTWGRTDLRIVLPRIPAMEVLVVRAADGTPVEEYGLRVVSAQGGFSSGGQSVIDGWSHPDGLTRITTLMAGGGMRIFVEPRKGTGLAPVLQQVEVDVAAPPRLTIRLPAAVEQRLRVVHADGRAAAGTRVELVDNFGAPVPAGAFALGFDSGVWSLSFHGIQIAVAETDADGRCTLAGPPDVPLTVRCFGDHPARVEDGVRLGVGDLELRLDAAGTVRVRVEPPEVFAAWRRAGRAQEDEPTPTQQLPRVKLWRMAAGGGESFPPGARAELVPFGADGVATLYGAPLGTWQVQCFWTEGNRQFYMTAPDALEVVPSADLAFVVDASAYREGSLSGRLLVAGRPAAKTRLKLQRTLDHNGPDGSPATEQRAFTTDDEGAFGGDMPIGIWSVFAQVPVPAGGGGGRQPLTKEVHVRALPDVVITAGAEHVAEFRGEMLRTEARVVDAAGEPVAGLQLWSTSGGWLDRPWIGPTNADGRTTMFGNAGSHTLICRIRSLLDEDTFRQAQKLAREAHGNDWQAATAALDAIVELPSPVPIPADGIVEIRLPAAWDR